LDLVVAGSQIHYHLVSGSFNMMNGANQFRFSSEGPATGYQKMDSSATLPKQMDSKEQRPYRNKNYSIPDFQTDPS